LYPRINNECGILGGDKGVTEDFDDKDTITEDFDLGMKIFKTSGRVEFLPDAVAWTYCPNNWKAWIRQRLRWSHGQFTTLAKHKDAVIMRTTYRILFILGIIDMLFMDIVLLFVRVISLTYILVTVQQSLLYPLIFMMMIYFVNELIVIITAIVFSSRKSSLRYVYLVPFIIFVYRPIYACIRFYAYTLSLFKREVEW
jgi:biofilm PGA synthesis N-glycosyltransferase PgaC